MQTQTTFERQIQYDHGDYKMTLDGRYIGHASTYHDAEVTLDQVAHDMLIHGDCATAEQLDGGAIEMPEGDWIDVEGMRVVAPTQLIAIAPPGFPDDDDDSEGGGGPPRAFPICRACATNDYPPSGMQPAFCSECVNAMLHGLSNRFAASAEADRLARTRLDVQIEQTMQRNRLCPNCQGAHFGWQCGEIRQALFAEDTSWKDIALGRELCRMNWLNHRTFVALLTSLPIAHLTMYAASYQAFIRSYRPDSDLTITQVLTAWHRMMRGDRGPAAPALRMAA